MMCYVKKCQGDVAITDTRGRVWCLVHAAKGLAMRPHATGAEGCVGNVDAPHPLPHASDRVIDGCQPQGHAWCRSCASHELAACELRQGQ